MKAFFAKVWNAIKGAFSKAWAWSIGHKVIAIAVAATVVVGTTCAIALPIALHNHKFAEEWCTDAENHWHAATCKHEEEKSDLAAHTFDNDCDAKCDVCGYERTAGAHTYDNACDTTCNNCGATRQITHNHATTWTAGETTHWYACSVCGDKKDEAAHTFDKTVAHSDYLKAEATETTKAQYWKSCVCGKASATEYFETDKLPANLQVSDISKTYDGTPVSEPEVDFDGVGAENFAYYSGTTLLSGKPTNAGTYKVVVTVDETETHAGDRVEREFTIAKKVLNGVTYSFTYGDADYYQVVLTSADNNGIIGDDEVTLEVCFVDTAVGSAVETDPTEMAPTFNDDNYVLGTYEFAIVPYDIDISDLKYSKVYDAFNDTITVISDGTLTGVEAETISLRVEMSTADVDSYAVGSYFGGSANTANYTFGGMTAEEFKEYAEDNAQITPKALQITGAVTKNYDGNNTFTVVFTEGTGTLDGNVVTVTFKLKDTATQNAVINIGPYSDATIYDAVSDDGNYVLSSTTCDAHVLDTNPLVLEVTDRFHIENDYILVSNIRQGSVKVGDSIVLPGSPDKVYEVLKIERLHNEQGQATLGEEVGIYIDGMTDLSEVARGDLLYTQGNIPTLATTFFANIYAYTKDEGGRDKPFFNNYKPNIVGLGALQVATIEIVDVYGKDDTMVSPGDRALVKITLTNAVPASLLENLNFTMMESSKTTITGTVVDYVESHNYGNSMVATDKFDAVAGMPTVIKLTNTRDETLDTLKFYYETVPGSGNYIIDFTIKLYDSSFSLIAGTFDNQTGTFTEADSSRWELAKDETCYIVLTTENDTEQVFGWLASNL